MHMSDALLSPAVGATVWAGTLGTIAYCSKKIKENLDEKMIPMMGVIGAFIFAAQMVNFTIPGTGSSGHLGGGMILAILLGPHAAFIVMASVLTIQALFFADGGLLALGCNIWNLGFYPCFIGYPLIYKPIVQKGMSSKKILMASLFAVFVGLQLGAFSVVLETLLSGRSELPFGTFVLLMQPIHLAIGVVEGFITAGVINFVKTSRPELLESIAEIRSLSPETKMKKIVIAFLVIAIITGGAVSWFASSHPDGLEWSIERVYGKPELPEHETGIAMLLKTFQEKTAFLPDYTFKRKEDIKEQKTSDGEANAWPNIETGTSVSGILGSVMMLSLIVLIGFGIKIIRKKEAHSSKETSGLKGQGRS
ncbi:MAG: cobalamin biosynthesis protein CbiM [Deltaproteobacteria bacterium]|nr:cobalamin biosynthesis protein CbiM [Deltaproteobacteria bacterium]